MCMFLFTHTSYNVCVDVWEVSSLFSPCGFWGSNSSLVASTFTHSAISPVPVLLSPPLFFLRFIYFMCMCVLPKCLCIICLPGTYRGQNKVLDPLELGLWVMMRHHRCTNWTAFSVRAVLALDYWAISFRIPKKITF